MSTDNLSLLFRIKADPKKLKGRKKTVEAFKEAAIFGKVAGSAFIKLIVRKG